MSGKLRSQLPPACPKCGYDPEGDRDEFVSGGGWTHDHYVEDGGTAAVWVEEFSCPTCGEVVARTEQESRYEEL